MLSVKADLGICMSLFGCKNDIETSKKFVPPFYSTVYALPI